MSRYRKVQVSTHTDEKYLQLSPLKPSGQGFWLYLLTGRHTTPIPGLSGVGLGTLADYLRWSVEDVQQCWDEVSRLGMARADFSAPCIWLPRAIYHNEPENPNVLQSWGDYVLEVPACGLRLEAIRAIGLYAKGRGKGFPQAFTKGFGRFFDKGLRKAFGGTAPETGTGVQEQEIPPNPPLRGGRRTRRVSKRAIAPFANDGPCERCGAPGEGPNCRDVRACNARWLARPKVPA
jgi:hypothetical protein